MASWHQQRNPPGLRALWTPEPGKWKAVHDRYGEPASCMTFDNAADAESYASRTGSVVVRPPEAVRP